MKAAQYVADFLVEHGVTHNFMVTGGGAMQLDDALGHKEGLHNIFNHNEQGMLDCGGGVRQDNGENCKCLCDQRPRRGRMQLRALWAAGWTASRCLLFPGRSNAKRLCGLFRI